MEWQFQERQLALLCGIAPFQQGSSALLGQQGALELVPPGSPYKRRDILAASRIGGRSRLRTNHTSCALAGRLGISLRIGSRGRKVTMALKQASWPGRFPRTARPAAFRSGGKGALARALHAHSPARADHFAVGSAPGHGAAQLGQTAAALSSTCPRPPRPDTPSPQRLPVAPSRRYHHGGSSSRLGWQARPVHAPGAEAQ